MPKLAQSTWQSQCSELGSTRQRLCAQPPPVAPHALGVPCVHDFIRHACMEPRGEASPGPGATPRANCFCSGILLTAPRTPPLTWEQKLYLQNGDCFVMPWPWETREAMTEQMQRFFQNRDEVRQ